MATRKMDREYDLVVVGATGYTGRLTATVIAEQLPTNLKWAIAGRSRSKLEKLAESLQQVHPNRVQPAIEVVALDQPDQIDDLVKRTKVCISLVLFGRVGHIIVRACAENGTDYVDCSGEYPDTKAWIQDNHEKAKATHAAIITGCGYVPAPHDLVTWAAVNELAKRTSRKTKEVILTYITDTEISVSGGTVESFGDAQNLDPKLLAESVQPWFLSPIQGAAVTNPNSIMGTRRDEHLGLLVASSQPDTQNRAYIHRTWGLLGGGNGYGPNFRYTEYESATSTLDAVIRIIKISLINAMLSSRFFYRYVFRPMFPASGDGPDVEYQRTAGKVGIQAMAIADGDESKRAVSTFTFPTGSYQITAVLVAQAAASLLYARKLEGGYEGGVLTPAMLGQDFIDRMVEVGAKVETRLV